VKTSSTCSWLHLLKSWSLLNTRGDSGYRIGSRFSTKTYATKDEAKLALFDDFWAATQDDERLWASD
jgi:hypothetical protein